MVEYVYSRAIEYLCTADAEYRVKCSKVGQGRAGQGRAGQGRAGQGRAGIQMFINALIRKTRWRQLLPRGRFSAS